MGYIKAALAEIFYQENIVFESWKRLWFVIKYVILKQTQLILKTLPSECNWNGVSIYIFVHLANEWRFNIYGECWTLFIAFQMKKTIPKTCLYCLIFMYIRFGDDNKKRQNLQQMSIQSWRKTIFQSSIVVPNLILFFFL